MTRPLLLALLLAGCGGWSTADTVGQLAATATLAIDYGQTRRGLDEGGVEQNLIMGPSGNRLAPELYFPAVAALSLSAAAAIPPRWRRGLQSAIVLVQLHTIAGNWVRLGYVW